MTPERKEIPRGIFTDALRSDGVYGQLLDSIAKRRKNAPLPISAAGLSDGAAVALCAALITDLPDLRPVLLLCPDEKTCSSTVSSLTRLGLSAAFFPARDLNLPLNWTWSWQKARRREKASAGDKGIRIWPDAGFC